MNAYCCTLPTIVYDVFPLIAPVSRKDLLRICHTAISKAKCPTELGLPDLDLVREIYNWDEGLFCHLVNKMAKLAPSDDVLGIMEMVCEKSRMYILSSMIANDLEGDYGRERDSERDSDSYYLALDCHHRLSSALERYAMVLNALSGDVPRTE